MKELSEEHRKRSGPGHDDLPVVLATGLPIVTYCSHFVFRSFGEEFYWAKIDGEMGVTELATLIALAFSILFALEVLRQSLRMQWSGLTSWVLIFLLGTIYFLGEEASWGQHFMGWDTPEAWAARNDQRETNLHNTNGILGSLLDQVPRGLLTLSAFALGFCYPLWRKIKSIELSASDWRFWLLPTSACMVVGLLAPFASVPGRVLHQTWPVFDVASGEIKELLLAQFMLLYILSLFLRMRSICSQQPPTPKSAE